MSIITRSVDSIYGYAQLLQTWLDCQARRVGHGTRCASGAPHLLLFAWEFAPSIAGGVYRPAALARYAVRAGWQVTVVAGPFEAPANEAGLELLDYVSEKVRIVRVQPSALAPSYKLFPRIDKSLIDAILMFRLARRELAAAPPAVVVGTGPPFHDFVAGYFMSRWARSKLVLDYRDEWTQCPFDFVDKGGANERWERRCLKAADLIIFTTKSQRNHLIALQGNSIAEKSDVIPNGWEPEEFRVASAASQPPTSQPLTSQPPTSQPPPPLTLLFAGKLGGHTDPASFLRTLARLLRDKPEWQQKLVVRLVGNKTAAAIATLAEFPFQRVLDVRSTVPRTQMASMMQASTALLLFHDARFERYLPGKLFDYVASGKPIIVFDDIGETKRLIDSIQAGWAIRSSDSEALDSMLTQLASGKFPVANECREKWLVEHTRERLMQRFLGMLPSTNRTQIHT